MKPGKVISILEGCGFIQKRQTGSHVVLRKEDRVVVVAFHGSTDIPVPTLRSIIKQSGLSVTMFSSEGIKSTRKKKE